MSVTTDKIQPVAGSKLVASIFKMILAAILFTSCSKKDSGEGEQPAPTDPSSVISGAVQPAGQTSSGGIGGAGPVTVPDPVKIINAAPVPGNGGALTASVVKADRASLSWTKATDAETKQADLKYILYISTQDNLGSVDQAEANGTVSGGYEYDIASRLIPDLSPETSYFVTVIVKDSEGKQAVYDTASFTTTAFPVPGGGGTVAAVHNGADIDVSWATGMTGLTYRLYYSDRNNVTTVDEVLANGTATGEGYVADLSSFKVVNPGPSRRFYFNVLVADAAGNLAAYNPVLFETDAEIFIAYIQNTSRDLLYAKRLIGQAWEAPIDVVTGPTQVYAYPPSLKVNEAGEAHIGYHLTHNGTSNVYDLHYAREDAGGTFNTEVVATIGNIGYYPALALKKDGSPAIVSYATDSGTDMYYFEPISGAWSMQAAFSLGSSQVGYFNALEFDGNDKAHACSHDNSAGDVYYVTNKDGVWTSELVDSADNVGDWCDIAVDRNGKIHLSYYNSTSLDLVYATNVSGAWVTTTVDASGSVGTYTSIDVDADGFAHISYYDSTATDVNYATNKSGAWTIEMIDGTGITAGSAGTSLRLDRLGRPHVAYYDGSNRSLKYAYKASDAASWSAITVHDDGSNYTGYYPSIDVK